MKHIVAEEGAKALLQGLVPRLATCGIVKLSLFTLYEKLDHITNNPALAGSCAGICNTLVSCPPDVVKCRLQMQDRRTLGHTGGFTANAINQVRQLASKRGLPGLYLGWRALLVIAPTLDCPNRQRARTRPPPPPPPAAARRAPPAGAGRVRLRGPLLRL
jgi:hypothetical protein